MKYLFILFLLSGYIAYQNVEYETKSYKIISKHTYLGNCSGTPCNNFSFITTDGYLEVSPEKYFSASVGSEVSYEQRKESSNFLMCYAIFVAIVSVLLLAAITLSLIA